MAVRLILAALLLSLAAAAAGIVIPAGTSRTFSFGAGAGVEGCAQVQVVPQSASPAATSSVYLVVNGGTSPLYYNDWWDVAATATVRMWWSQSQNMAKIYDAANPDGAMGYVGFYGYPSGISLYVSATGSSALVVSNVTWSLTSSSTCGP